MVQWTDRRINLQVEESVDGCCKKRVRTKEIDDLSHTVNSTLSLH